MISLRASINFKQKKSCRRGHWWFGGCRGAQGHQGLTKNKKHKIARHKQKWLPIFRFCCLGFGSKNKQTNLFHSKKTVNWYLLFLFGPRGQKTNKWKRSTHVNYCFVFLFPFFSPRVHQLPLNPLNLLNPTMSWATCPSNGKSFGKEESLQLTEPPFSKLHYRKSKENIWLALESSGATGYV